MSKAQTLPTVFRLPQEMCSEIKKVSKQTGLPVGVVVKTAVHLFVIGKDDVSKAYRDYEIVKNVGAPMKRLALIRLKDEVEAGLFALRHEVKP